MKEPPHNYLTAVDKTPGRKMRGVPRLISPDEVRQRDRAGKLLPGSVLFSSGAALFSRFLRRAVLAILIIIKMDPLLFFLFFFFTSRTPPRVLCTPRCRLQWDQFFFCLRRTARTAPFLRQRGKNVSGLYGGIIFRILFSKGNVGLLKSQGDSF